MNKPEISKTRVASVIHNQTSRQSPKLQEEKMKNTGSEDEQEIHSKLTWELLQSKDSSEELCESPLLIH